MDWKVAAAVPVLLVIILAGLFVFGQPRTQESGVKYKDVNGNEYLPGDYVIPGGSDRGDALQPQAGGANAGPV